MTEISKAIAKDLLTIEAVFLRPNEPFTWASGIKSPIYCDNRMTMSYPAVRKAIASGLAAQIKEHFPDVEVIAGTATAGIPHAAWVADILDLPMLYPQQSQRSWQRKPNRRTYHGRSENGCDRRFDLYWRQCVRSLRSSRSRRGKCSGGGSDLYL